MHCQMGLKTLLGHEIHALRGGKTQGGELRAGKDILHVGIALGRQCTTHRQKSQITRKPQQKNQEQKHKDFISCLPAVAGKGTPNHHTAHTPDHGHRIPSEARQASLPH